MKIKSLTVCYWSLIISLPLIILSCKKDAADPCAQSVCLNNGYCANGDCVCPEGYGGADCSRQITPRKIKVTKVELIRFPATDNNGAGWDPTSGPDIYVRVLKGESPLWKSSNTYNYQNANPSNVYSFDVSPAIDFTDPEGEYTISLYDYDDFDADDFMGGIIFTPYHKSKGFPSVLTIDAGGTVAFKLHLSYTW